MGSYDGPATLIIANDEHTVDARLWSDEEERTWGGDVEGDSSLLAGFDQDQMLQLQLPDGRTGNCFIEFINQSHPSEAEVRGSGVPPF